MTSGEHYFTANPASAPQTTEVRVDLAGRQLTVHTAAGVFSAAGLDLGTSVLLRSVPDPPPGGDLLDLGCGWGPIALTMALLSPQARVWGVDVNERALQLLAGNAARLGLDSVHPVLPSQLPGQVRFAAIWSNPPIRVGKAALHQLLLDWLPRLEQDGDAFLVVQRNLGSDSLHTWLTGTLERTFEVSRYASAKGFRVLRVHRRGGPDLAPA